MCKKTVISRACKLKINSSNDQGLGLEDRDDEVENSTIEIEQKANNEHVDFEEKKPLEIKEAKTENVNTENNPDF
jgi:recombinational DNA repair protein RecT